MKVTPYYLTLLILLPVSLCHSRPAACADDVPKYDVAKQREMENTDRSTYPKTGYRFTTPSGWSFKDNPNGFMRAKIIKTAVGSAKLEIKFLTTPANGYTASKKGELLRQSIKLARLKEVIKRNAGFKGMQISDMRYRNYPAFQAEFLTEGTGKQVFHQSMFFDNGQGIFDIHGTIGPAPASPNDRSRSEFDRAWKHVLITLAPETILESDKAK